MSRSGACSGALLALVLIAVGAGGCNRSGAPAGRGRFEVLAAENFWGSVAAQLAGDRASTRSIIVNPNTDPHSYEPTARDARSIAGARLVIVNGIGYDDWAPRLLGASPLEGRIVLNVGSLLGIGPGGNPHQWYSPAHVLAVANQITADYERIDPADRAYFARLNAVFETRDLARYDQLRREIRARYAGVPVGYSESIFQPLGEDLGLRLKTPYGFTRAVAEGLDVTAADKQAVDGQVSDRAIRVWIFNSQNVTPDVQRVNRIARERRVPTVTVTETLAPASATFEQWQSGQLERLIGALRTATGR